MVADDTRQNFPANSAGSRGIGADAIRQQIATLADLSAPERHALRSLLMLEISSRSASVRAACAHGLGRVGDDRAIPLLLRAGGDADPLVRWHAIHALRSLEERRLVPPGTLVFEAGAAYMRWKKGLIGEIGGDLSAPRAAARFAAIAALVEIDELDAVPFLLGALLDEHAPVRRAACEAIARIAGDDTDRWNEVAPQVLALLNDADRVVRRGAADILGMLGRVEAVPLLLPLLHDADSGVRWSVCEALGRLRDRRAVVGLCTQLADDEPWVRRAAALALRDIGATQAQTILLRVVGDEHVVARRAIVDALATLGDGDALPALTEALADEDEEVVLGAIRGLRRLRDRRVVPALKRLRRTALAGEAVAAIREIERSYAGA